MGTMVYVSRPGLRGSTRPSTRPVSGARIKRLYPLVIISTFLLGDEFLPLVVPVEFKLITPRWHGAPSVQ